jgi:hypothetical protein
MLLLLFCVKSMCTTKQKIEFVGGLPVQERKSEKSSTNQRVNRVERHGQRQYFFRTN